MESFSRLLFDILQIADNFLRLIPGKSLFRYSASKPSNIAKLIIGSRQIVY
jgi:hypothetical protein